MASPISPKIIAVIGATGAQGLAVCRALLAPSSDGTPSPFTVRALTRNPEHRRAKELRELGADIYKGSYLDFPTVERLFDGAYGAFVNTDGFTCGEVAETHSGIVIYELAKIYRIRHFIYSSLDDTLKAGGWDPKYKVDHYIGKSRVAEYIRAQPNEIEQADGTMWTVINTGPYMETVAAVFSPLNIREDGTRVFASPLGETGRLPLIAVDDIAWWARHTYENPKTMTGRFLDIASDVVSWPQLVETFTRVTGLPAVVKNLSLDEFFSLFSEGGKPLAGDLDHGTTVEHNFRAWFRIYRDNLNKRDMEWIRSVRPESLTLEQWIRDTNWKGDFINPLKNVEDGRPLMVPDAEKVKLL